MPTPLKPTRFTKNRVRPEAPAVVVINPAPPPEDLTALRKQVATLSEDLENARAELREAVSALSAALTERLDTVTARLAGLPVFDIKAAT